MPKKRGAPAKGKHRPEFAPAAQGTSKLRSLKDRLSMIRFRLWKSNNQANAQGHTAGAHGGSSLRQKLGSGIDRSYRFVANRLAVLRHLHPVIKGKGHWLPSQLVRWDLLGVSLSWMWGKVNSATLPRWARTPLYKTWGYAFKANLAEAARPLHEYPTLKDFFTRQLKEGVRPLELGMISPCDSKIVTFGEVTGERVEHIKGITYPVAGFLGTPLQELKKNPANRLYHAVLYLAPGDYHRIHSPVDWSIQERRHFPGTLFPVAPAVTRLIPNLLALNERVVLNGNWEHGFYSLSPVGAYNVGSIIINFDPEVKTNVITRDFRCPNLRYFSYKGVGTYAYQKPYAPSIDLRKGDELGAFNLGSTVVLFFEFEWAVTVGDKLKMGQKLGDVIPLPPSSANSSSIDPVPAAASPHATAPSSPPTVRRSSRSPRSPQQNQDS